MHVLIAGVRQVEGNYRKRGKWFPGVIALDRGMLCVCLCCDMCCAGTCCWWTMNYDVRDSHVSCFIN